jgi:hypothetical protein
MWKRIYLVPISLLFIIGCSQNANVNRDGVEISGQITYDRVPSAISYGGIAKLDYKHTKRVSAKNIIIKAIDTNGQTIAQTTTDKNGKYSLFVPANSNVKIRGYARMYKKDFWDVSVVDNTNAKALYVIEGQFHNSGNKHNIRNLNASSGWSGDDYHAPRVAAPFAILDSINQAMDKVRQADKNAKFPQLTVNWSVNNIAAAGDADSGQIITSNYDGERGLWILGDANSDTDEYDDHIIIHEWGHYFENKFSRADSIGGSHGDGNRLDIRVAFGEGWGNAFSAIATDNPIYFDTQGIRQSSGFSMNIESDTSGSHGWFSEDSIQRILYDLYDSHNDGADTLSLGFKPIYNVLVGFQKNTPAFTSIFTFITGLQEENKAVSDKIDDILRAENIQHINDIYGSGQSNLYSDMGDSGVSTVCTSSEYGRINKLYNHKYVRFSINKNGYYNILVKQQSGYNSDPDFGIYKTSPFEHLADADGTTAGRESGRYNLTTGEYLLDVGEYNGINYVCFDVTIN